MKLTTWITLLFLLMGVSIYSQQQAFAMTDKETQSEQSERININTADIKTLSTLPGVGVKKAEAIVAYRDRNGNFTSVEELVNVKGIGEKMLAKMIDKVTIGN
ncbi:ComEA family DNA-binding protein [Glaciecola sp. 1036]|uniref:ComEA family DNA-binding protein n=1 Tax=Alteromonadaceae TaxID=72275 RepID=UPI003CFD86BA